MRWTAGVALLHVSDTRGVWWYNKTDQDSTACLTRATTYGRIILAITFLGAIALGLINLIYLS